MACGVLPLSRIPRSHTLDARWLPKDFPDPSVLTYERPLGAFTLPPVPLWSVTLGCYVRPQPVEFLLVASSDPYHRTRSNAIPVMLRKVIQPERAE